MDEASAQREQVGHGPIVPAGPVSAADGHAGGCSRPSPPVRWGYLSSLDSLRSANGFPPVWHVGQYCSDFVAKETWRIVSPHTGQA